MMGESPATNFVRWEGNFLSDLSGIFFGGSVCIYGLAALPTEGEGKGRENGQAGLGASSASGGLFLFLLTYERASVPPPCLSLYISNLTRFPKPIIYLP